MAQEAGSEIDDDLVIAGLANDGHYLNFQRSLSVDGRDDWGIHVEFDAQGNSGYEKIKSCSLSRQWLRIEFTEPFDWQSLFGFAEIELQISDAEYSDFADGLRAVFAHRVQLLAIQG